MVAQNSIKVNIEAPVSVNAGKEYILNVEVNKSSISGFAKLELYLPVGFISKIIEAEGSTVILQNQLLKFIWIELPEISKINLTIAITVDSRLKGYKEIYGNFHYLLNNQRQKYPIAVVPINIINENSLQQNNVISEKKYSKIVEPIKIVNQNNVYRVQLAANKRKIKKEVLQELYIVTSAIKEEIIDGLYKYTVGDFATKEDADIFRVNCGVAGAFILNYENGVRIQR